MRFTPAEDLWRVDDMREFSTEHKENWDWTMMIDNSPHSRYRIQPWPGQLREHLVLSEFTRSNLLDADYRLVLEPGLLRKRGYFKALNRHG